MKKENLVVIANEKVYEDNQNFYCNLHDEKSIPEGLSKYNNINYIVKSSNKKGKHKINISNIKVSKNIFFYIS